MNIYYFLVSIILYLYGLRNCGDIDVLIYKKLNKFSNETIDIINTNLIDKNILYFLVYFY